MRAALLVLSTLLLSAGWPKIDPALTRTVDEGSPALVQQGDLLLKDGIPFSGMTVREEGGHLLSRTAYRNGRRDGLAEAWYPDGSRRFEKIFRAEHREGTHRGWWPDGTVQFVYRYENDLFEGEQLGWYKNGVLAETRHYHEGREEGRQTAWSAEGRITSNYVFKEGKRYGVVGRFDCVSPR